MVIIIEEIWVNRKELGPASPTVKKSRKNARFEPREFKLVFNRLATICQGAKKERKGSTLLSLPSLSMNRER